MNSLLDELREPDYHYKKFVARRLEIADAISDAEEVVDHLPTPHAKSSLVERMDRKYAKAILRNLKNRHAWLVHFIENAQSAGTFPSNPD